METEDVGLVRSDENRHSTTRPDDEKLAEYCGSCLSLLQTCSLFCSFVRQRGSVALCVRESKFGLMGGDDVFMAMSRHKRKVG